MTVAEIKKLLRQTGLRPQAAAGHNFLLSSDVVSRMVKAADVTPADKVLEIGPGFGILTDRLLAAGAAVTAVELDQRLYEFLSQSLVGVKNLNLIRQDIWQVNLNEFFLDEQYKVVANLPYSSTALFFRNFLSQSPRPSTITVMIQDEVARRLTAGPGEMSLLSVMAKYYSRPEYLFKVDRQNFFPVPRVDSAVVRCVIVPRRYNIDERKFWRAVKAGFSSRRKQLRNALAGGLRKSPDEANRILLQAGVNGSARAQDLSIQNWLDIAKIIN